jgi:N-acetylglucosaminyldiphosphoundecaprenol N-acetyl-beta-D-mannosaminyltransferase
LPFKRRYVLGVPVDLVDEQNVLDAARAAIENKDRLRIITVNAEFVVKARENSRFAETLRDAELSTPDGAGVVWALRRQGVEIKRLGGSDLIWSLSQQAARLGQTIFLLGAGEGVAAETGRRLADRYPGLSVGGALAGSPRPEDADEIVQAIRDAGTDILFVAFGAPKQEIWLSKYLDATGACVGIGVGGSFDYVAGVARRAPVWMRERGLDWLWRLVMQPWRWRRMLALPRFALLVLTNRDSGATDTVSPR